MVIDCTDLLAQLKTRTGKTNSLALGNSAKNLEGEVSQPRRTHSVRDQDNLSPGRGGNPTPVSIRSHSRFAPAATQTGYDEGRIEDMSTDSRIACIASLRFKT